MPSNDPKSLNALLAQYFPAATFDGMKQRTWGESIEAVAPSGTIKKKAIKTGQVC
jgi:hypothetical protein